MHINSLALHLLQFHNEIYPPNHRFSSQIESKISTISYSDSIHLYTTVVGISKPILAAVDGYVVGLGLQIALCCDYRMRLEACQLFMPELRMSIACNFGGFMLEAVVGRAVMQKLLSTSDKLNAQTVLKELVRNGVRVLIRSQVNRRI